MTPVRKSRRRGSGRHTRGHRKRKFWIRLGLYFIYFSASFIVLYYLFDRKDMLRLLDKDPEIFYWRVFGLSFLFALGLAAWMYRDPKLTGK